MLLEYLLALFLGFGLLFFFFWPWEAADWHPQLAKWSITLENGLAGSVPRGGAAGGTEMWMDGWMDGQCTVAEVICHNASWLQG